jgi:hypothetical protein
LIRALRETNPKVTDEASVCLSVCNAWTVLATVETSPCRGKQLNFADNLGLIVASEPYLDDVGRSSTRTPV